MENLSVWQQAGVIIISGLLIVFIGLILLILVIWVMGSIAKAVQNSKEKPSAPAGTSSSGSVSGPVPPAASAPLRAETLEAPASSGGELIAVIAAAVAAISGTAGFTIKSVKRTARPSGRSAWASAGVMENTRPF